MIQLCILFILSWILTVVVEGGAARLFFGIEKKEQILLLLVNTVTNPLAVLLSLMLPAYTRIPFNAAVLAAEALVFISEGFLFRKCMIWQEREYGPWRMALVLLVLLLVMAGCGKKGAPMPDYSRQLFSWRNVFATLSDEGCVSVSGSVGGEAQNLAFMVLELEPLDASCAGCPFVPQETYRVNSADAWESPDGQTFRFAYCPATRSEAYRWRLVCGICC